MINLQKIFNNNELHTLPNNYKQACYEALISYLTTENMNTLNLQNLYKILTSTSIENLSHSFSTFFYSTIRLNAYRDNAGSHQEYDFLLFLFAFDTLFQLIDNNSFFKVECPLETELLLPLIGINLALSKNINEIGKSEGNLVLKTIDQQTLSYQPVDHYKISNSLRVLHLTENNYLYQNIIKQHASFDLIKTSEFNNYFSKLEQAITRLQMIDKEYAYHLQRLEALIPMAFVAEDITKSFTLSGIPHLVFLSDCNSVIKLMENLIHESLHDELNIFMNYYELITSKDKAYYSPWRNDPRPIRGLLHATYVFTGIFNFYSKCLRDNRYFTADEKAFIIFRYSLIYYELGLAFHQLECESSELTKLGSYFIETLKRIYNESCSSYLYPHCPASILNHLKHWQQINADNKIYIPNQDFFSWKQDNAAV